MPFDLDLFVIGGGSGGVRCARIAAGHGARVAIAESRFWGGTCVNVGCVPKKLLVMASGYAGAVADARAFGWRGASAGRHDWAGFISAKNDEIARLNGIYVAMLERAGVAIHEAHATMIDAHTVEVGGRRLTAERIVIATGGRATRPDIPGAGLGIVSDDAFFLPELPPRVALVGGGYIALEFAGIMAGLGASVDLVFRQDLPLRGFDADLRRAVAEALTAQGVRIHAGQEPRAVEARGPAGQVLILADGREIPTDLVFFATGRVPNTAGLGLDRVGVTLTPDGAVKVDAQQATSLPHVFAIGDVTDRLNLTPVAIAEGHMLADRLFGPKPRHWSFDAVPTAVFSQPPLATVGLTEEEAARRGPVDIYLTQFTPLRQTISGRAVKTLIKLVVDQASDRVVGAHMMGEEAPETIQAVAVAITAGATKADFDQTIGVHPTAAEELVTLRTRTRVAGLAKAAE